jgi:predicted heme/steroid binding protein
MAIPIWLAAILGVTGIVIARIDYNIFLMKFFRNLSRSKARARLNGNKFAMIPVMLGLEEPLTFTDYDQETESGMTVTREQLAEMDGFDGAPLYLSIKRRVYDVSAGARFYGEGKEYSNWVGRDASRSFGTGCRGGIDRTGMDCLSESLDGLTASELKEIDRWLELYETHDKYTFVGHLVDDPVNDILEQQIVDTDEQESEAVIVDTDEEESEAVIVDTDEEELEAVIVANDDETPLIDAHTAGRMGDMAALTAIGTKDIELLKIYDVNDWTPLHEAARFGHLEAVKFLIDNGLDKVSKCL